VRPGFAGDRMALVTFSANFSHFRGMSEDTLQAAAFDQDESEARFSMRTLLIAMAVLAVVAALAGPIVRGLDPDRRARLLLAWGGWLAATIAWIAYQARERLQAERAIGRTILRVGMFDEKMPTMGVYRWLFNLVLTTIAALFMLTMYSEMIVEGSIGPGVSGLIMPLAICLFPISWIARLIAMIWWRRSVRFGELGVLWDRRVLRWDHIVEHRWEPEREAVLELKGIDQKNVDMLLKIPVPIQQSAVITRLVASDLVIAPCIPNALSEVDLARVPISEAFRSRHLAAFTLRMLLRIGFVVGAMILTMNGVTGVREFDRAIWAGFIVPGIILVALRSKVSSHPAGRPLVRLSGRRSWIYTIGVLALGFLCYELGTHFSATNSWIGYSSGFGLGYAASELFTHIMWHQLDLRENAVVWLVVRSWPWASVRLVRWNLDSGRLVLSRGWSRIVAKVPAEQREAVDYVLGEKLTSDG
jgi:hypothetical protein